MTDQDRINAQLQRQLDLQNARIEKIDVKLDNFGKELRDFKAEMRDRDNQRAAEMRDRDNQRAAEIAEIRASLQNMQSSSSNLNIVTLLGIAAIVIAVLLK